MPQSIMANMKYHGWKVENIGKHASNRASSPAREKHATNSKNHGGEQNANSRDKKQSEFMTWSTIGRPNN
jgi:hypothetical protein